MNEDGYTLIFDLDGLLADTEKLHRQAYQDTFEELGLALSDHLYDEHWIRDGKGIRDFIAEHDLSISPDDIRPKKAERYDDLVRSTVQAMPGALQALARLRPHRTLALATSSYPESALAVLETLDIKHYFSCIATKSDVERVKPFPDIFLHVASQLSIPPTQCLVLEDAEKGILAADAAGMLSIAIPNEHTKNNDFSKATLLLDSLEQLTLEMIQELERK